MGKRSKTTNRLGVQRVQIRVDPDIYDQIEKIVKRDNRTVSQELSRLVNFIYSKPYADKSYVDAVKKTAEQSGSGDNPLGWLWGQLMYNDPEPQEDNDDS